MEKILLSAAYYEAFSKLAELSKKSNNKEFIADQIVTDFYKAATDINASKNDIIALGNDLHDNVMDTLSADDMEKTLENEIFSELMDSLDLEF